MKDMVMTGMGGYLRVVALCVSVGANGLLHHFNLGLLSDTLGPL